MKLSSAVSISAILTLKMESVLAVDQVFSEQSVLRRPWGQLLSLDSAVLAAHEFWEVFGPGGRLHPAYFLEHKGHLVVEGLLLFIIAFLFLQTSFKPRAAKAEAPLTDKEVDQLCREWEPEPLVPAVADPSPDPVVVTGTHGIYATVDGVQVLNVASGNFFNLSGSSQLMDISRATIDKYGVGSCGPRGFYGTIDVHLHLEEHLAEFMGTPAAIIYSFDLATVASIIPAFANRQDILVVDEYCSYPIQSGCTMSRAKVVTFKHNDCGDLERVLKKIEQEEKAARRPLTRRFIIVEGIYANYGDMAPLDRIYAIKEKFKYRLLVEESFSFGVVGRTGRGACEHFGLQPKQVEIICASMGNALASVGGFCVGEKEVVEHQRLSGSGYCFSASLPPFLATAASAAIHHLRDQGRVALPTLAARSAQLRKELRKITGLRVVGADEASPLIHLQLAKPPSEEHKAKALLQGICNAALQAPEGVLLGMSTYSLLDTHRPPPSLRLFASVGLDDKSLAVLMAALRGAVKEVGL